MPRSGTICQANLWTVLEVMRLTERIDRESTQLDETITNWELLYYLKNAGIFPKSAIIQNYGYVYGITAMYDF